MVHRQTNTCSGAALFDFDRFPKLFGFLTKRVGERKKIPDPYCPFAPRILCGLLPLLGTKVGFACFSLDTLRLSISWGEGGSYGQAS
jgi:hypothetical protein